MFMDEASFRFDHALIHDAAYRSLLKRERAELHERFAAWLEAATGGRSGRAGGDRGYHLEQSARHLMELGPLDERGRGLAGRASAHLGDAGSRASSRGDMPAAVNLLDRAVALLPTGRAVASSSSSTLPSRSRTWRVRALRDAASPRRWPRLESHEDDLLATNAALVQLFLQYTLDPEGRTEQVVIETGLAIPALKAADDHEGLVRAWRLLGWVHGTACHYGAAEHAVQQAVHHARLAGDRRAETRNLMSSPCRPSTGRCPSPRPSPLASRRLPA